MKYALAMKLVAGTTLLGAALAAPTIALAEDVIDDATIAHAADQNQFDKLVAQRQAKMNRGVAQSSRGERSLADIDRQLREEAMQPGGVGD